MATDAMAISSKVATVFILFIVMIKDCHGVILFKNLTNCGNPPMKLNISFKTVRDSYQVLNGNYSSKIVCGENLRATMKAQYLAGGIWMKLFSFEEKRGVCALLDTYIGPLFHDMLKAAGMLPSCPVPPGTYHWTNYRLNINLMKLTLPAGQMRIRVEGVEKRNNEIAVCIDLDLEKKM